METGEYRLLPSQKDFILSKILGADLDPSEFEWQTNIASIGGDETVDRLVHKNTGYYFEFDYGHIRNQTYGRISSYSPGKELLTGMEGDYDWGTHLKTFESWLGYLKRELKTRDLWANYLEGKTFKPTDINLDISKKKFTEKEIEQLQIGLDRIEGKLSELECNDNEQINFAVKQIKYLREGLKRLEKTAWLYAAIGVIVTIGTSLKLDAPQVKELWGFIKNGITGFVEFLPG